MALSSKFAPKPKSEAWGQSRAASEVWKGLEQVANAVPFYPPTNSTFQGLLEGLHRSITAYIERFSSLRLGFDGSSVTLRGESVFSATAGRGLALAVHEGGVRSLTFLPGVDRMEVLALAQALAKVSGESEKDYDLATLLWFRPGHDPRIIFEATPPPGTAAAAKPSRGTALDRIRQAAIAASEACRPEGSQGGNSEAPLHQIGPDDRDRLRAWVQANRSYGPTADLARGFEKIAETDAAEPSFRSDCDVLKDLLHRLVELGAFDAAVEVRDALERFAATSSLPDETLAQAREVSASLAGPRTLDLVLNSLLQADDAKAEAALRYLGKLPPAAADRITGFLGKSRHDRRLCAVLARVLGDNLGPLAVHLDSRNPKSVCAAVHGLGECGKAGAVPLLERALGHGAPAVRIEAIRALARMEAPSAREAIARSFLDSDRSVRRAAYRYFSESAAPYRADLEGTRPGIEPRELEELDDEERLERLRAVAASGEAGVSRLIRLLETGGLFGKRKRNEIKVLACQALGEAGGRRAAGTIRALLRDRDEAVREAAQAALQAMGEA